MTWQLRNVGHVLLLGLSSLVVGACGGTGEAEPSSEVSDKLTVGDESEPLTWGPIVNHLWNKKLYHVWALYDYYTQAADGTKTYPLGPNARGKLILTETGYFALTFTNPDRPNCVAAAQPQCTAAEVYPTLWRGHLNFAGQLEIANTKRNPNGTFEGDLNLHTEEALFPNIKDTLQVRHFIMETDRVHMHLEQPSIVNPGSVAFLWLQRLD